MCRFTTETRRSCDVSAMLPADKRRLNLAGCLSVNAVGSRPAPPPGLPESRRPRTSSEHEISAARAALERRRVLIRSLPGSMTCVELQRLLTELGFANDILTVVMPGNRKRANRNRGYAYVEMLTPAAAGALVLRMDQWAIGDRVLAAMHADFMHEEEVIVGTTAADWYYSWEFVGSF